jgi:hypothetical protein
MTGRALKELGYEDAGFEIVVMIKRPSGAKWLKWLNRALLNSIIDHLVLQYVFVAVKKRDAINDGA